MKTPSRMNLIAAFAAVYLIWGSTYLAIRMCVATMPPFLMAGLRFLVAGSLLHAAARLSGAGRPTIAHWGRSAVIGGLLILAGNGLVVWAARRLPSSTTALMIAMAPLWFTLLAWIFRGERPSGQGFTGVLVGFGGIVLLVGGGGGGGAPIDAAGALALLCASLAWASGSLVAKAFALPGSPSLTTSMTMIMGGLLCTLVGLGSGELERFAVDQISVSSWGAFLYLIVFGSLIGFTAYGWLIRNVTPARLSTYAYVNPVVALILGATVGGETLTAATLVPAAICLCGVVMMTTAPAADLVTPPFRALFTRDRSPRLVSAIGRA